MNPKKALESGDLHSLMALLEHAATRKSAPKYLAEVNIRLQAHKNAIEPLPIYGNELVRTVDGIDFSVAELSLKGTGSIRVNSNHLADRLGAHRFKFNQLIQENMKFLNEFGIVTFEVENTGKRGRPGKHYLLNQAQATYLISRTETETGRAFAVVLVKAFYRLIDWYLLNRPKFEIVRRENVGTGLFDQNQELQAKLKDALARAEHWEAEAKREAFGDGAFDEARVYKTRPGSKRQRAGHVRTVSRVVVNTEVQ